MNTASHHGPPYNHRPHTETILSTWSRRLTAEDHKEGETNQGIIFIPNFSWLDNAVNSLTEHKQIEDKMTYHFSLVKEN